MKSKPKVKSVPEKEKPKAPVINYKKIFIKELIALAEKYEMMIDTSEGKIFYYHKNDREKDGVILYEQMLHTLKCEL